MIVPNIVATLFLFHLYADIINNIVSFKKSFDINLILYTFLNLGMWFCLKRWQRVYPKHIYFQKMNGDQLGYNKAKVGYII